MSFEGNGGAYREAHLFGSSAKFDRGGIIWFGDTRVVFCNFYGPVCGVLPTISDLDHAVNVKNPRLEAVVDRVDGADFPGGGVNVALVNKLLDFPLE